MTANSLSCGATFCLAAKLVLLPDQVAWGGRDTLQVHPDVQPRSGTPCRRQKMKRNPCGMTKVERREKRSGARAETRERAMMPSPSRAFFLGNLGVVLLRTAAACPGSLFGSLLAQRAAKPRGASAPPPRLRGERHQAKIKRHVQTGCTSGPQLGALANSAYVRSYVLKRHTCSSLRL